MENIKADFDIEKDDNSAYFQDVAPFIYQTVNVFSMLRNYIASRIDTYTAKSEYVQNVAPIIHYVGERCQALIMLTQYGYLWDADMVMRCILEATIKIGYLSYASDAERKIRALEYWEALFEINQLRRSERAKLAIQIIGEESLKSGLAPLILSAEEEAQLRGKWPSKKRHEIEQKWSFAMIINSIEKHLIETTGISTMKSALWAYGLSSHLIHADETAIRITGDRLERPEPEKRKMTLAHAARLLSDEIAYLFFAASAITYALEEPNNELKALVKSVEPLFAQLNELNDDFYKHIDHGAFSEAASS